MDNCEYREPRYFKAGGVQIQGDILRTSIDIFDKSMEGVDAYSKQSIQDLSTLRSSTTSSLEEKFNEFCDPTSISVSDEVRTVIEALKVNYAAYVGEEFSKTRAELYYTEGEHGPDIVLPTGKLPTTYTTVGRWRRFCFFVLLFVCLRHIFLLLITR